MWDVVERVVQNAGHVVQHHTVAHARAPARSRHQVGAAAHRFRAGADRDVDVAQQDALRC
jgi:hypothetical protein